MGCCIIFCLNLVIVSYDLSLKQNDNSENLGNLNFWGDYMLFLIKDYSVENIWEIISFKLQMLLSVF